jgi:predicted nucleic acid-binding protein
VEPSTQSSTLSSSSEVRRTLRRLRASERLASLQYRQRSELPFLAEASSVPKLLLDTTVYIDELQGKLPRDVELAIRSTSLWHSTVTECELSALAGLLNPDHPGTTRAIDQVLASIEQRPSHRIVNPDREVWRDAGMLAGFLARVQQYGKAEQRKILNDALIFLSAAKAGLTVLTRNISDFDLLMQLSPHGKVLFYDL